MKTILKSVLLLFLLAFSLQSCEDQDDVAAPADLQINNFIWKGLNQYYLWQADVPNLADNRFSNQEALNSFLRGYSTPENLFQDLLNKPISKFPKGQAIDRFSWIVEDYTVLEQELQGTSKNDGVDFRLSYKPGSTTELVGFVRYILPNSNASTKAIKRGDLFTGVNGTQLTASNYQSLLGADSYTLNLATYDGTTVTPNGKTVSLAKTTLDENPIFINKVITSGSHKIGYLMYNGFYANYDAQLNAAFADLKTQGITDFVLDLRYNGGGSIQTATRLASMITGQFKDKIFAKIKWNTKVNAYYESEDAESLNDRFVDKMDGAPINSLNLSKIYVITTGGTASASELVINGLVPYISVIKVGETTVGKNVGSITVYDSPTFGKTNRNPNHKYAMQPLVLKIVNAADFGEYTDGLKPTIEQKELIGNLGTLGDPSEPLLSIAISNITGSTGKRAQQGNEKALQAFTDSKAMNGVKNQMYLEKAPEGLLRALK
ncbi:peptidase S41-like protein [Flavobacterium sp. 90]|uniref:S41 family peptidase n=1 Tax=unclassified Flavobacterium TaxID=196869 RepID=UPI000EB29463|nr:MULTISPECIES: S41 family peptidase [unclassified Flavobacterium]RKR11178.1 peptidase S41-like protein [Flavobacterium sp. 81]TCK54959.1 peptidase S41-like protein [Flavobacterium sp. 90]